MKKFPCLAHAYSACETGGTLPCVLNAANEVAVDAFLHNRIGFNQIPAVIEHTMSKHDVLTAPEIDDILRADQWARTIAAEWINCFCMKRSV
jgi:1-deoxy-D-xylulose-5-phosphate reductoisomerase